MAQNTHLCIGGCGLACPDKPKRTTPKAVGEYKATGEKGMGRWVTVTVLAPSNRGRNARGSTGSKRGYGYGVARGAKRAKRQGVGRMGRVPVVTTTNWSNV